MIGTEREVCDEYQGFFFFISMIRCVVIFSLVKNIKEEKQAFGKRQ